MHKLESFAISCGSKISKPFINQFFYPIKEKKFICFSKASLSYSKEYSFFDDVIFHIQPYLEENNISILEIGRPNNQKPAYYTKDYSNLNALQSSYLINKSLMYFGNYNLFTNIASTFSKKVVCPSNIEYESSFFPYWSSREDCKIVMPKSKLKPSNNNKEFPKTIDEVKPEEVALNILKLLKIKNNIKSIKTIFMGNEYNKPSLDVVPGQYNISQQVKESVNLRLDKNFDLNFLNQCHNLLSINLVTDKSIPESYLSPIKNNIHSISYFIKSETKPEDIKEFEKIGKPLNLLCKNAKKISNIRLKFIDHEVKLFENASKNDLKISDYKNLKFLTKRNVLYNGQMFNSYISASLGKNVSNIVDDKIFWEDLPFLRIFEEKNA